MIADLGLSKQVTVEVSSISKVYGMPAYVEPQCYKTDNYVRNKKSDIYSLGVLLWEISSGYPPFLTVPIQTLGYKIAIGFREQPIIETPSSYIKLYQKCWDDNPDSRPTIDDAFDILKEISLEFNTNNECYSENTEDLNKLDINNEITSTQSQSSDSTNTNDDIYDLSLSQIEDQTSEHILIYLLLSMSKYTNGIMLLGTPLSSVSSNAENKRKSSVSSDVSQTETQTGKYTSTYYWFA
jgi:serine/threonine protein kinase